MIQVCDLPRVIREEQFPRKFMQEGAILFLTEDSKNEKQYFIQGTLPFDKTVKLDSYLNEVKELENRGAIDHISHIVRVAPTKLCDRESFVELISVELLANEKDKCCNHKNKSDSDAEKNSGFENYKKTDTSSASEVEDAEYREYLRKKKHIERMKRREEMRRKLEMRKRAEALGAELEERCVDICAEIKKWLAQTTFCDFLDCISKRVKGQVELERFLANMYHYFTVIAAGGRPNNNVLLAAPSGCGKTETYRALKEYFKEHIPNLPIAQIDMTSVTEEGFRGADTKDVIRCLAENPQTKGVGLIFMDEFDKKLVPSYTSGGNNVNAAVQAQLLTLIEGREIPMAGVDTNNTLFVGLGSFDVCRSKKTVVPKSLGFNASVGAVADHYDDITREDMIEIGASYEMLGRFSMLINYHKLDAQTIDSIIDENVYKIAKSIGYAVRITDEKRAQLHQNANGKFGCRLLYNEILDSTMAIYPELLKNRRRKGYYTIVLDADGKTTIEKGWNKVA